MDFSEALIALKKGFRIARKGWNGKRMHIALMGGYPMCPANGGHALAHNVPIGSPVTIDPYISMKTANGTYQPGWLASQPDLLADDWEIVE